MAGHLLRHVGKASRTPQPLMQPGAEEKANALSHAKPRPGRAPDFARDAASEAFKDAARLKR